MFLLALFPKRASNYFPAACSIYFHRRYPSEPPRLSAKILFAAATPSAHAMSVLASSCAASNFAFAVSTAMRLLYSA
jgi:hypothetical protein